MLYVWGVPVLASVPEIVQRLKAELQSQPLLKDMKVSGNNLMVTCPFHKQGQERRPSCGISLTEGVVHCFKCGYVADLPTFVSNVLGKYDGGLAGYKWITKNFVNVAVDQRTNIDVDVDRKAENMQPVNYLSDQQLARYRYIHPYMYQRKLTDKVINYFDVGYDATDHSLVFPLRDLKGRVPFVIKRSIIGKHYYFWPKNALRRNYVYGLYEVYKNLSWVDEVWLTEGPIDGLTCWGQRIAAVSFMGAAITENQLKLIEALPVRKFVLAFDADEAGEKACQTVANNINKLLYRVEYVTPGDINDQEVPLKELPQSLY